MLEVNNVVLKRVGLGSLSHFGSKSSSRVERPHISQTELLLGKPLQPDLGKKKNACRRWAVLIF